MTFPSTLSRRAFTLIELLVVISIIGVLAGLLLPAIQGAIDMAHKAQAKNDAVQIATAINAFATEYSKMPPPADTGNDVTGDAGNAQQLWDALMPPKDNTNSSNPNKRGIVFIQAPDASKTHKGGIDNGKYVDPWGQPYVIAIDGNYDNSVAGPDGDVRKTVLVWSTGKPKGSQANTDTKKFVKSWE